jgi:hypothetical protein
MIKIVEALVEPNVTILGTFLPYQDNEDRKRGRIVEYDKMFSDTRNFYTSNGYELYKSNDLEKFRKHITFKENNFALVDDILYDIKLCNYDINPSDQLIKKLSLR